jgi:hypothetical protein
MAVSGLSAPALLLVAMGPEDGGVVPQSGEEGHVSADLEQLMRDASALAGQLQHKRLSHPNERPSEPELRNLELRLQQTWTAIRQARLTPGPDPTVLQRHPKWG